MSQRPAKSSSLELLTRIWQQVLQRSEIGPDDDFFDLCSDDARIDLIFAEINRAFGRELPSATICYARTIASLARVLDGDEFGLNRLPSFPSFVQLKSGEKKSPIFILPGVGGRASFSDLAKNMQTERAIYGLQAKGVDGRAQPLERIEDMADFYLSELRGLQPRGPYFLIGYSFGGLLALEMAQRLLAGGDAMALLAMMDTFPDPRYFPLAEKLRLGMRRLKTGLPDRLHLRKAPYSTVTGSEVSPLPLSFAATMERVKASDCRALAHYRPRFYQGTIKFVMPVVRSFLPSDPGAIWRKLSAQLDMESVPGDHAGMVATHFKSLAAVLSRYVREASESES
jgi:acetoacetyl-CoA synthetase